jgi:hypothetical protein
LRLDAVHALVDTTAIHVLEELATETDALAEELGRPAAHLEDVLGLTACSLVIRVTAVLSGAARGGPAPTSDLRPKSVWGSANFVHSSRQISGKL